METRNAFNLGLLEGPPLHPTVEEVCKVRLLSPTLFATPTKLQFFSLDDIRRHACGLMFDMFR